MLQWVALQKIEYRKRYEKPAWVINISRGRSQE
jgi:hypothetical protein